MPAAGTVKQELTVTMVYVEDYDSDGWGWWCPECSTPELLIMQDGYVSAQKARRSALKHEIRRGHQ